MNIEKNITQQAKNFIALKRGITSTDREFYQDKQLYDQCCMEAIKFKYLETVDEKRMFARSLYEATMWGRRQDELLAEERLRKAIQMSR